MLFCIMYIHNLDPIIFNLGFLSLRWYSVAYILGIVIGWWYGKKILSQICLNNNINFKISLFDDYISYVIIFNNFRWQNRIYFIL